MSQVEPELIEVDIPESIDEIVDRRKDESEIELDLEIQEVKTPLKQNNTLSENDSNIKKKTPKQLEKEKLRLEREKKRELERKEKEKQRELEKQEKERQRELEKQERERNKEAERKQREEKRIQREEEKRKRDEEKDRIKRELEAKKEQLKQEREEKERLKLEEKLRKEEERRLTEESKKKKDAKLKISNFFKPKSTVKSVVPAAVEKNDDPSVSDYEKTFKPFFIREGTTVFNWNKFSDGAADETIHTFDSKFNVKENDVTGLQNWFKSKKQLQPSSISTHTASYIYENQLDSTPIEIKSIQFYENIISWRGSFTTSKADPSIAINPFSEPSKIFIEWDVEVDEEEEGDMISENDDEEEEEDDEDEDDFDDFLEDDNNSKTSKRVVGPLVPSVTWKTKVDNQISIEILKQNIAFPINAGRNYWKALETDKTNQEDDAPVRKKPKSLITRKEDLETFVQEVNDNDYPISAMIEILKKQLPSYTKVTIENTLKHLAKRVGPKVTEKKWQVDTELLKKTIAE